MSVFDRRHRWGEPIYEGARITRVCRACGRSETYDTIIPHAFVDVLVRDMLARVNPYRSLFRR